MRFAVIMCLRTLFDLRAWHPQLAFSMAFMARTIQGRRCLVSMHLLMVEQIYHDHYSLHYTCAYYYTRDSVFTDAVGSYAHSKAQSDMHKNLLY